jgi:hypothetical protein
MKLLNRSSRWLLLVLAAGASFLVGEQWLLVPQDQQVQASQNPGTTVLHANTVPQAIERDPTLEAPQRARTSPTAGGDAFARLSWLPPPPKVVFVAPPPPPVVVPTAPPLPFTFVGLLEQGLGTSQPKAFLTRGDALLVVAAGDTVEDNYSIDSITAQQITMTYLPLKTRQVLNVSGALR